MLTAVSDDVETCTVESVMHGDTHETIVDMPELNAVRESILSFVYVSTKSNL